MAGGARRSVAGGKGRPQPRSTDHCRCRGAGDSGRNLRRDARGFRRVSGNGDGVTGSAESLLSVERLTTVFDTPSGSVPAVDDVSFEIREGETLGLVGESGSGKSVTAFSVMRLVQPPGRIRSGRLIFKGRDLLDLAERDMRRVRGAQIALIFQEPMTALNPVFTIGDQIRETLLVHGRATKRDAGAQAVALLEAVRMSDAGARVRDYPH